MEARVNDSYPISVVRAFSGHEYVRYEWRRVPAGVSDREIQFLGKEGLLEFNYPETQASEIESLESLRQLAKEAGIAHFWQKKGETLLADLAALDEEE